CLDLAKETMFAKADSWYMGANIPGKVREMLMYPGGLTLYLQELRESAEKGYTGYVLDSKRRRAYPCRLVFLQSGGSTERDGVTTVATSRPGEALTLKVSPLRSASTLRAKLICRRRSQTLRRWQNSTPTKPGTAPPRRSLGAAPSAASES